MDILKEACVGNYIEAKKAYELGANRLELCDNLKEGGTTPSYGTIVLAKKTLNLSINVMIRPRGGNYIYTEKELSIMEEDIDMCREVGVDGVVLGVLTEDNKIDEKAMKRLIKKAQGLSINFHMAFDEIEDRKTAIDKLVDLGIDRVLTKGGLGSALENQEAIKELIDYADNRIVILAGGGLTRDNYIDLVNYTGVKEVHGTKIVGNLVNK